MGLLENGFNENQSDLHSISLKAYAIPQNHIQHHHSGTLNTRDQTEFSV